MKRRTRITLALSAIALTALGGTYGLVAQQGIPTTSGSAAPDPTAGSSTQTQVGSTRSLAPAVVHSQTRGS